MLEVIFNKRLKRHLRNARVEAFLIELPYHLKLFIKARETRSSPVLPSGIIIGNERGDMSHINIFVELASAPEDDTDVITIPGGEYMCLQQEFERRDVLYPAIYDSFISRDIPGPYFVTNMHFGSGPYNRIIAEIQAKTPVS